MGKRKREEDSDEPEDEAPGIQRKRLQYKLYQGIRKLGHAFKTAKGFERQKLGRRQKHATVERIQKDIERIEAEIASLKQIDNAAAAQNHLFKTLLKIKAVTQSPVLSRELEKPPAVPTDLASVNVNARLCNSNPVKEVLPDVMDDLLRAASIKIDQTDVLRKKRIRKKDYQEPATCDDQMLKKSKLAGQGVRRQEARGQQLQEEEDGKTLAEPHVLHGDGDSEDDLAAYDGRLASSGDDAEEEELDVDDLERQLELEGVKRVSQTGQRQTYNPADDMSLSGSGTPSPSASPEPQKAPSRTSISKQAFVPSLTLGGYISGSGSDISDIDEKPRKNKRGQRARQAIWEKKFGANAKHLQTPKKDGKSDGWDAKRGATDRRGGRGDGRGPGAGNRTNVRRGIRQDQQGAKRPQANGDDDSKKHKDDSGPLHPSWEAAKRAKEKKSVPVAFQGKKMVFD